MIPRFLERLKQGSNDVEEMTVSVSTPATLLFARHVEALLREFATFSRSSWDELEDEYWTVFNCNPDEAGRPLGVFIGWMMKRDVAIEKIWIAVGGEGILRNSSLIRKTKAGEANEILPRLRALVELATEKANKGVLYSFDVVTRVDATQAVLPLRPMKLGEILLVSIPREADADKLGWGHNPGLAVLTKVEAADIKDAEQAAGKNVFELLLFWTLISGSYCHPTKLLFSAKSISQQAKAKALEMAMAEASVERFHRYTRVDSNTALGLAEPLWQRLQALPVETKTKVLSSMAAYRAAQGVQRGIHFVPTLAVVAYIAALESLIGPPSKCDGNVTCSKCGPLQLKHDKRSNMKSILEAVLPMAHENVRPDVENMLKHAYRELRSAYVHSAQTEWREFAGAHLWQDITDADEFWREERPFRTLFRLDEIVREFIISRIQQTHDEV